MKATDWDEMSIEEQLAWARHRLKELSESAESDKTQAIAAGALARSLEASVLAKQKAPERDSPTPTHDRSYLEAVKAEIEAKLAEMEKVKS